MSAAFADFAHALATCALLRGPARQWAHWERYLASLDAADRALVEGWRTGIDRAGLPLAGLKLGTPALLTLLSELSGWDREVIGWCHAVEQAVPATYRALLPEREDDPRLTLAWVAAAWSEAASLRPARRLPVLRELCAHASPTSAACLLELLQGPLAFPSPPESAPTAPLGTCLVVITAASGDHAERSLLLTDYTIAARQEEQFLSVGTVWTGLDDPTIEILTRLLQRLVLAQKGQVVLVEPKIVLEVAHSGIRPNGRRQSKLELIAPRIVRWCCELGPEAATTLEDVMAWRPPGATDAIEEVPHVRAPNPRSGCDRPDHVAL